MILKYEVPKTERKIYNNKRIIYCKIKQTLKLVEGMNAYNTEMINLNNRTNIFLNVNLKKLNLIDKIRILKYNN